MDLRHRHRDTASDAGNAQQHHQRIRRNAKRPARRRGARTRNLFMMHRRAPPQCHHERRRAPVHHEEVAGASATAARGSLGVSSNALMVLLCIAGVACCVAMAMPQVHIVAYCGDLGYGTARGSEMLSMMMGFGIISRLAAG